MFNKVNDYLSKQKESFRAEIRRQDRERIFNQKRIQNREQFEKQTLKIENIIENIINYQQIQNYEELKKFHKQAFNYVSSSNTQISKESQEFLIKNNYLQHSLPSLLIPLVQCDVIRTLANSCSNQLFFQQQPEHILKSIEVSFYLIHNIQDIQDISDILIYLGNIASKSVPISQQLIQVFPKLLELSNTADINLYRNLCFLMHNICTSIESICLNINERIICLKIIENGVNRMDCDLLQNEILHPLTQIYQQSEEIDNYLQNSKIVQYVMSTQNGEYLETTLRVIKQFSLTETLSFANFLIDQNVLELALEYSNNRKQILRKLSYLIIINLSYNDSKIANRIIQHKIINRIVNGLIVSVNQERQNCMQVIINLQKTGDNNVYKILIELGIIKIIYNLIDDTNIDTIVLRIFIDSLCRFLHYAKEVSDEKVIQEIQEIQPKIEQIFLENKDPKFQDLFQTFIQLIS